MRRSRPILLLLPAVACVAQLLCGCHAKGESDAATGDPEKEGLVLARRVVTALGGQEHWNDRSWDLAFDFVVLRQGKEISRFSHLWHRATNEYLVSGRSQDGKIWQVHFADIYARRGTATIDGRPAPDSSLAGLLDMGYGRFINDGYWLLMPVKLLDSGVHHRREADTVIDGIRHEVLTIWFDHVGLTPGDRYWLYVNAETGRPSRWRFLLESGHTGTYLWEDYRHVGPLLLSLRKEAPDGSSAVHFENVGAGKF